MNSKHIILVANSTWNIYNFRLNLIRKLLEEEHRITVIAPIDEYIEYKEQFEEVKHIPLQNNDRSKNNLLQDFKLILELKAHYKKLKPDLVIHYTHKPNIYGGIAAKMTGVKSIAVVTGLGYAFINNGWLSKLTSGLYKLTHKYHVNTIFENDDDLEYFKQNDLVSSNKGIAINGCGVDTNVYVPFPNGHRKEKIIFTFIGRLLYDKGIVEFVDAARDLTPLLPNAEFWIIGELDHGNPSMIEESSLLTWIDEGFITYHGFVKDVKPLIAKSDCIVLPSYREGMPRIVLEAMSMAKPVITTRTAGCRQTVEEGENGLLVDIKNSNDLCNAITSIYNMDYEKRHIMGTKGRALAEKKFNSKIIANDLYEIISNV